MEIRIELKDLTPDEPLDNDSIRKIEKDVIRKLKVLLNDQRLEIVDVEMGEF